MEGMTLTVHSGWYKAFFLALLIPVVLSISTEDNLSCISYNWIEMICDWSPHNLTLCYTQTTTSRDPDGRIFFNCLDDCHTTDKPGRCTFKPLHPHCYYTFHHRAFQYFRLTSTSGNTNDTCGNLYGTERISPYDIVKPGVVKNVITREVGLSSVVNVSLNHPLYKVDEVKDDLKYHPRDYQLLYRMLYAPAEKWKHPDCVWKNQEINVTTMNSNVSVELTSLTPGTVYSLNITSRHNDSRTNQLKGYWSDSWPAHFNTTDDVPAAAPVMSPTGYFINTVGMSARRNVTIFYKMVPDCQQNGILVKALVSFRAHGSWVWKAQEFAADKTSVTLTLQSNLSYDVTVDMANSKGYNTSLYLTPVSIISQELATELMDNITLEMFLVPQIDSTYLEWTSVPEAKGFTIFWCYGSRRDNLCTSELLWKDIPGHFTNYTLNKLDAGERIFAISADLPSLPVAIENDPLASNRVIRSISDRTMSSGMVWSLCTQPDKVPNVPPVSELQLSDAALQEAGSLAVQWHHPSGDGSGCITKLHLTYCTPPPCKPANLTELLPTTTQYTLHGLEEGAKYSVWMTAVSPFVSSEQVTLTAEVSVYSGLGGSEIAGIVIAVIVVLILAFIGLFFFIRNTFKKIKEHEEPIQMTFPTGDTDVEVCKADEMDSNESPGNYIYREPLVETVKENSMVESIPEETEEEEMERNRQRCESGRSGGTSICNYPQIAIDPNFSESDSEDNSSTPLMPSEVELEPTSSNYLPNPTNPGSLPGSPPLSRTPDLKTGSGRSTPMVDSYSVLVNVDGGRSSGPMPFTAESPSVAPNVSPMGYVPAPPPPNITPPSFTHTAGYITTNEATALAPTPHSQTPLTGNPTKPDSDKNLTQNSDGICSNVNMADPLPEQLSTRENGEKLTENNNQTQEQASQVQVPPVQHTRPMAPAMAGYVTLPQQVGGTNATPIPVNKPQSTEPSSHLPDSNLDQTPHSQAPLLVQASLNPGHATPTVPTDSPRSVSPSQVGPVCTSASGMQHSTDYIPIKAVAGNPTKPDSDKNLTQNSDGICSNVNMADPLPEQLSTRENGEKLTENNNQTQEQASQVQVPPVQHTQPMGPAMAGYVTLPQQVGGTNVTPILVNKPQSTEPSSHLPESNRDAGLTTDVPKITTAPPSGYISHSDMAI